MWIVDSCWCSGRSYRRWRKSWDIIIRVHLRRLCDANCDNSTLQCCELCRFWCKSHWFVCVVFSASITVICIPQFLDSLSHVKTCLKQSTQQFSSVRLSSLINSPQSISASSIRWLFSLRLMKGDWKCSGREFQMTGAENVKLLLP